MTVHFVTERLDGGGGQWNALCPAAILSGNSSTTQIEHVTCADCAIRLVAELHRQQAVLLKTIAGLLVVQVKS